LACDGRPRNVADLTVKPGRQAVSIDVKFRQAMSSFVKPLLDGAICNFKALRETFLSAELKRKLRRPTPPRTEEAMKIG